MFLWSWEEACCKFEVGRPDDSLFVWSKQTIDELNNKKDGNMQRMQLNAVAYLWELCYDLLLATDENVSVSPGFEAFGLRVNR